MAQKQGVLSSIRANQNGLSTSGRQVAEYVSSHLSACAEMSMLDIAQEVGVSDATVLRFVRSVGYDGFNSFKIALMAELLNPSEAIFEKVQAGDSYDAIAEKVISSNIQLLQDTIHTLEASALERTVQEIGKARRIFVMGVGTSGPMVEWLFDRLTRLGYPAVPLIDTYRQFTQASIVEEGDLLIVISRSGAPVTLVEVMEIIREHNPDIPQIVITCDKTSPIASHADVILTGVSREVRGDIAGSVVIISAIIDVLYTALELVDIDRTVEYQRRSWRGFAYFRRDKTPPPASKYETKQEEDI